MEALADTRRQEQQEQQRQLMMSLKSASDTAVNMASAALRDNSRTPRRKRPLAEPIESSPEQGADKKEKPETDPAKLTASLAELSGKLPFT